MWVLKLEVESEKQFLGKLAIKHNVLISGYPLSYNKEKNNILVTNAGQIFGTEKSNKDLIKDLKKSSQVTELEVNNNFIVITSKVPLYMEPLFNSRIIQPEPIIIDPKTKSHIWTLASFKREELEKVIKFANKYLNGKLLKLKEEKINNISITSILPNLSQKQHQAMQLAMSNGYYKYPKNIKMKELAIIMDISYSTFQEHLKKAESKLISSLFK